MYNIVDSVIRLLSLSGLHPLPQLFNNEYNNVMTGNGQGSIQRLAPPDLFDGQDNQFSVPRPVLTDVASQTTTVAAFRCSVCINKTMIFIIYTPKIHSRSGQGLKSGNIPTQ